MTSEEILKEINELERIAANKARYGDSLEAANLRYKAKKLRQALKELSSK